MSEPAQKKRRVNNNNVLFKPFKSPMKTELVTTEAKSAEDGDIPAVPVEKVSKPTWGLPRTVRAPIQLNQPSSSEMALLRREEARLASQLTKLRSELDQVKQARQIEDSGRATELTALITLWKRASQEAAEDVYATVRDKVNAAGGMRKWKEMEKARQENSFSNWGTEPESTARDRDDDNDDDEEQERDDDGSEQERVEQEAREEHEQQSVNQVRGSEPEAFSMDVMLQYVGIKPDLLGYDVDAQRWVYD